MPTAVAPLPIRSAWAPEYLRARPGAFNRDFAFRFEDPQGAPSNDGRRYHGAVDWFAPGGTSARAPEGGVVIRSYRSSDRTGPVFGGVLEIETPDGGAWVMRHVDPIVSVGARIHAGQIVARVTPWYSGGDHGHFERWRRSRRRGGTYHLSNFVDPSVYKWVAAQDVEDDRTLEQRLDDAWFPPDSAAAVRARLDLWKKAGSPSGKPRRSDSRMYRRLRKVGGLGHRSAANIVKAFRFTGRQLRRRIG